MPERRAQAGGGHSEAGEACRLLQRLLMVVEMCLHLLAPNWRCCAGQSGGSACTMQALCSASEALQGDEMRREGNCFVPEFLSAVQCCICTCALCCCLCCGLCFLGSLSTYPTNRMLRLCFCNRRVSNAGEQSCAFTHTLLFVFPSALQFGGSLVRWCCNS